MTSNAHGGGSPGLRDRFTSWVLDHDGDIYGDERERQHWYEGIAIVATVQWIALPWALAIMVWFADTAAAMMLLIAMLVFYLPIPFANVYVGSKKVRVVPDHWSRKRVLITVVGGLPYIVFAVGFIVATGGTDTGGATGAVLGGLVGGGLAVLWLLRLRRVERRREAIDADID